MLFGNDLAKWAMILRRFFGTDFGLLDANDDVQEEVEKEAGDVHDFVERRGLLFCQPTLVVFSGTQNLKVDGKN